MNLNLSGKVVLITGAGSGIGQAMSVAFAQEGAKVLVNDLGPERCEETLSLINALALDAVALPFDVSNLGAVQAACALAQSGHGAIDVLVNNAAVLLANQLFLDTDPKDCDREIQVGLYGTMHCTRAILPGMIERRSGRIVNLVSDAARLGQERESTYACSKGAVISFTKSIAREVGRHGITVNAISPAATDTPLRQAMLRSMIGKLGEDAVAERERKIARAYPMKKIGTTQDVASVALFLASDLAGHITGQVLGVNGGYAMVG
jgi:2-hydroxycyclohexanecarboxyl-CoA dehydrogenase